MFLFHPFVYAPINVKPQGGGGGGGQTRGKKIPVALKFPPPPPPHNFSNGPSLSEYGKVALIGKVEL